MRYAPVFEAKSSGNHAVFVNMQGGPLHARHDFTSALPAVSQAGSPGSNVGA